MTHISNFFASEFIEDFELVLIVVTISLTNECIDAFLTFTRLCKVDNPTNFNSSSFKPFRTLFTS